MLPDFLCIGAMRAGSTWLYRNLKEHPELWLPPIKELHYFDSRKIDRSPGVITKFFSASWPNKRYRSLLLRRAKDKVRCFRYSELKWDYKFFFKAQNDVWYSSLFEQSRSRRSGEITPAYSTLDEQDVEAISRLMPKTKILFILRNPIERAWSQAVAELGRHKRDIDAVSEAEWLYYFNKPQALVRSDYVRTVTIWKRHYPKDQFFIGYFDDIVQRPQDLLLKIFGFLEVAVSEKHLSENCSKRFNAGAKRSIPDRWRTYLAKMYCEQIREISEVFGGPAELWLKEGEEIVNMGKFKKTYGPME